MKAQLTYEFSDRELRALRRQWGKSGRATLKEASDWMWAVIRTTMDDVVSEPKSTKKEESRG